MVNGKRIDGNGPTRKAARDDAKEKARRLGRNTTKDTVAELFSEWRKRGYEAARVRPSTFDQYTSLLATHVIPHIGHVLVRDLDRKAITVALEQTEGTPSTRRSTYAALVKLVDYAVSTDQLQVNVARQAPRPPSTPPKYRTVDAHALGKMLAAARGHRWEIAVWLAFGLGLRRGEILGLRWSHIDWETRAASVTKEGNVVRTSAGLSAGPPKTRAGVRHVPISEPVLQALRAHRLKQQEERLRAPIWNGRDGDGPVLATHLGDVVEPRALSRTWKGWAEKAGLEDTGIHVSRHYAATVMLGSGKASVADVAASLGHDPTVLLSTYASAVADGQRQASDALGSSLARAAEVTSEVTSPKTDALCPDTSVTKMSEKRRQARKI